MRVAAALVASALLAAGCGEQAQERSAPADKPGCRAVGSDYRICGLPRGEPVQARPHIDRRDGDRWREIAGPRGKKVAGMWHGHWQSLHVAHDGETLLATWSGECEVPTAYFLPAAGGQLRPVAGNLMSIGLGWSKSGEAKVELLGAGCGDGAKKPGVYLVDPQTGRRKFVEGPLRGPLPLKGS